MSRKRPPGSVTVAVFRGILGRRALDEATGAAATLFTRMQRASVVGAPHWWRVSLRESGLAKPIVKVRAWGGCGLWGPVLIHWSRILKDKLALVRMRAAAAPEYANYGAGRSPRLAALAASIKARDLSIPCAIVALRVCAVEKSVAGAGGRFVLRAHNRNPNPERQLCEKLRDTAAKRRGRLGADVMASDSGEKASTKEYRCPPNSACEGSLPGGKFRRFPPADLTFFGF